MPVTGQVAAGVGALPSARPSRARIYGRHALYVVIPLASVAAALGLWQLVTTTGLISEQYLSSMSSTLSALWDMVLNRSTQATFGAAQTTPFWDAVARTVRGWALGLAIATALAVPFGILLGTNDYVARAFRVPIEFLRPIPSVVLIPVLLIATPAFGISLRSEVFLAAYGAFWPLLVQTMYGVRDVDPVAIDTARSFGVGPLERLRRVTLPSAVPYIVTGIRLASQVSLILAFTAELVGIGSAGLGQSENIAQSYALNAQVYAIAVATGILGLVIHLLTSAGERRILRWHPSHRGGNR